MVKLINNGINRADFYYRLSIYELHFVDILFLT